MINNNQYNNKNSVHFLQWNCHSVNSNKIDLIKILNDYNIKYCFLQETFLRVNYTFKIKSYNIIRNDREDISNYNPRGGVAFVFIVLLHLKKLIYCLQNQILKPWQF